MKTPQNLSQRICTALKRKPTVDFLVRRVNIPKAFVKYRFVLMYYTGFGVSHAESMAVASAPVSVRRSLALLCAVCVCTADASAVLRFAPQPLSCTVDVALDVRRCGGGSGVWALLGWSHARVRWEVWVSAGSDGSATVPYGVCAPFLFAVCFCVSLSARSNLRGCCRCSAAGWRRRGAAGVRAAGDSVR